MSQWNQSQKYFEYLLKDYSHNEDLAWIEHSLGQAHYSKGEWNESQKYYDRSYERMMRSEPVCIKDSAVILSDIGEILYSQGTIEEFLFFHQ
jgi:tetratricopeptide (TPR) repeat protein